MAMPASVVVKSKTEMDQEREGLLMWLRGEFAAANAIIDALCHHLCVVGEPGEYDNVISSIHNRRLNWNPLLHMQQYFSVAEIIWSLQQVGWKRLQQQQNKHSLTQSTITESKELDEKSSVKSVAHKEDIAGEETCDADGSITILKEKQNGKVTLKTFVATEICDGRPVNVVDGMKLYEKLIEDSEVTRIGTLVNDLRAAGRLGKLQGQTFVIAKRPTKGHGREIIRFGIPSSDAPSEDEAAAANLKTEPIPGLLEDVMERLLEKQVVGIKPDSCIIDIYNEGDYSQPYIWPQSYGRPVCVLFLTECEMSFGKVMAMDHPGNYRGALRLSLLPGSMLVMQGRSADYTRHAIPSLGKQRILITFTKSHPSTDLPCTPSSRPPPKHIDPVCGEQHFVSIPPAGIVIPVSATPVPNGIQQVYIPMPVVQPAITFPLSTNAMIPTPRHHHCLPLVPAGTGVFLPSQSSSNQFTSTVETKKVPFNNDSRILNRKVANREFNGKLDGTSDRTVTITGVEQHHSDELCKSNTEV